MAKRILAIDPNTNVSAALIFEPETMRVSDMALVKNAVLAYRLQEGLPYVSDVLAIEMVAYYGMAVGREVFETCFWTGKFCQAYGDRHALVYRMEQRMQLCHDSRAKATNIRQALIDIFGGQAKAIGAVKCKACKGKGWRGKGRPICTECNGRKWETPPGPLADVSTHLWAALAVAITYCKREGLIDTDQVLAKG